MGESHLLVQYISNARQNGLNTEQIAQALAAAGWRMRDVIDIILEPVQPKFQEAIITVDNVSKNYGKVRALEGVSLEVKRGSVTALLGPNGAGKTTLVRIMTTLLPPTNGQVTVAGYDVVRDAQQLRAVIGLAGQFAAVDEVLSGKENLEMVARLYHLTPAQAKKRAAELLVQFELEDAANRPVKTYSGGMRRRLDLAASLVIQPKILFLDEPTTGLDPHGRQSLWNIIRDLVERGTTVLLTTQYLEEADQFADQIFVINHGRIIAQGTSDELKKQVGGDIVELHLTNHTDAPTAAALIQRYGHGQPHADSRSGIVTMPVSGGTAVLADIIRVVDSAKLKLSDIMMRRPSLDDVFIKLTGESTT